MSIRRILVAGSLLVLVALSGAYHVLFVADGVPERSSLSIDWERVRTLAGPAKEGPRAIRSEVVAHGFFYGWMVCAGCGWGEVPMEFRTYQLVYGDGKSVVVDAVHDANRHASMPTMREYDVVAFARQTDALRRADRILLTHEHWDHANGLRAVIGEPKVRERMLIPDAQRRSQAMRDAGLTESELASLPALADVDYRAVAPGVVAIAMPGHTPGSQVIYVRRADGAEYLMLGDIVWSARNLRERRGKSRLISWVAGEARGPLLEQIAYFADLAASDRDQPSKWHFIVAHDPEQNAALIEAGWIEVGLILDASAGRADAERSRR
jgi:glyoxylase-like metal-dependent hydrolase (beta-lactamase superfamily II)